MKKKQKYIYLFMVIIPVLLCIFGLYHFQLEKERKREHEHIEWVASIHKKQMDQFIGETKASLDILSISLEYMLNDLESVQTTLKRMAGKDPRYSGIYLLDFEGNVMTGTNDLLKQYNLRDKAYIRDVLLTKQFVVSERQETLANGQSVIAIATPVMHEEKVEAILVAHIQIDYIRNIIELLTPGEVISFENTKEMTVLTVNTGNEEFTEEHLVKYPLEELPWNIVLQANPSYSKKVIEHTLIMSIGVLVLLHVLFLLLKYAMLKRQTKIERLQNETQKLELIGTLAASTAHEIRNPLTGIKGLVQLLSEKYKDQQQDQFYFSVINKEIGRINQIVSELLILGKPTAQKLKAVDLREIINDLTPIIHSEANLYNVEYTTSLPPEEVTVCCAVDQMKQVILNLTKNAFEAMPSGGTLDVRIYKDLLNCHIDISDSGGGISAESLEKIFLPFYTSKENGTGLGLVVCKRIIESFGGTIQVESQINEGTNIKVSLPLCTEKNN
ncbi:MAG TPA: ATP-binding protein [Chondromyces sp.]|nr:ATP-binding protein [Chondromyces sp.]